MDHEVLILLLSRLLLGAVASFFAILLWAKTRDTAWMLIILGVIIYYSETVYSTLEVFGIVREAPVHLFGVSLVKIVFSNLPMLMFCIALAIMIRRKRLP